MLNQPQSGYRADRRRWGTQAGFTLVEVLVVVVIIAILAAVAFPSFAQYVRQSRRSDAMAALVDLSSRQEQYFLDNKTYTQTIGTGGLGVDSATSGPAYVIRVDDPDDECALASCYVLRATPQGRQVEDSCGELTLDSTGESTPVECWN